MGLFSSSNRATTTNNSTVNDNRVSVGEGANVIDLGGGVYDQSVNDHSDRSLTNIDNSTTTSTTDARDLRTYDYSVNDSSDRSLTNIDNSTSTTDARDLRTYDYSVNDSSDRSLTQNDNSTHTTTTDARDLRSYDYSVNDSSDRSLTQNDNSTHTSTSTTDARDLRTYDYSVNDSSDRSLSQTYNITQVDAGLTQFADRTVQTALAGAGTNLSNSLDFASGTVKAANDLAKTSGDLLAGLVGQTQDFARGFIQEFYVANQSEEERGLGRIAQLATVAAIVIGIAFVLKGRAA